MSRQKLEKVDKRQKTEAKRQNEEFFLICGEKKFKCEIKTEEDESNF